MLRFLRRLCTDVSGPTAVEYAVMLALIVAVCLVSIQAMARATAESFDASSNEISAVFGS